jgi:hypothetical protein
MIPAGLRNPELMYEVSEEIWLEVILECQELSLLLNGQFNFDHFFKAAASQNVGPEFIEALDVIDRLGNDEGREALIAAGEMLGVDMKFLKPMKVRDAAAQIWLKSQKDEKIKRLLNAAHVRAEAKRDRLHKDFIGKNDGAKPRKPHLSDVKAELKSVLAKFQDREHFVILPTDDAIGQWHYYIVRPDTAKRMMTYPDEFPVMVDVQAGTGDHISYDPQTNRLRIATRSARLLEMYRAAWGILIAKDAQYFSDHNICTLAPLHKHGEALFKMHRTKSIISVEVTELHWRRGDEEKAIFRAPNCFKTIKDMGIVGREGEFVEAKLLVRVEGRSPKVKVHVKVPGLISMDAGSKQNEVERMLGEVGIRAVQDENGDKQTFWSMYPWKHSPALWRRYVGPNFDEMLRAKIFSDATLERVTHPAHPVAVGALAVQTTPDQVVIGIPDEDQTMTMRVLTPTDLQAYELNISAVVDAIANSLQLAGERYEMRDGLWCLGHRELSATHKANVFLASRPLSADTDSLIKGAPAAGTPVLIIPHDVSCMVSTPTTLCRLPQGPFNILDDIVRALGLEKAICPTVWSKATLLVNTVTQQITYRGLRLTRIGGGSHPYKFALLLSQAKGAIVDKATINNELNGVRADRGDDGAAKEAKRDFVNAIKAAYQEENLEVPSGIGDIFKAGNGGYRLTVDAELV